MSATSNIFKKFNHLDYFIETGTHVGSGIRVALDAGFEKIHSIEIYPPIHERAKDELKEIIDVKDVNLHLGSSVDLLDGIMKDVNSPALIWLDAHYSGNETGGEESDCTDVVLSELETLKEHELKNENVILIDDIRGHVRESLEAYVEEHYPEHLIEYFDANDFKDDIMCIRKI